MIKMKKTNNAFLSKLKYYKIINYLKQLKLEKKVNPKLMKKYSVMIVLGNKK